MSYDMVNLEECDNFCALTWLIFADLVTYTYTNVTHTHFLNYGCC